MKLKLDRATLRQAAIYAVLLAVGILVGWLLHVRSTLLEYRPYREQSSGYHFISPLLFVDVDEEYAFPKFRGLKQTVTAYADETLASPAVEDLSIYFRNVNTSQWIAVNPDERYAPGSMLKVITLMSVLRVAEDQPDLLGRRVVPRGIEEQFPTGHGLYEPENPVRSGRVYTVEELLRRLVVDSDNGANAALSQLIGEAKVLETYDDLQLPRPTRDTGYTPREYSRVFRALYNGTYLSHDQSEAALKLLSTTSFTPGIVAGVPDGVVVSHKFGVRNEAASSEAAAAGVFTKHELHDCGIVYHPRAPYFICVMTRGTDLAALEEAIKEASALVWKEVERLN
ncbi:MAG TPA: serine hydrolase [Candidatus Paceibacterota bacterium]|nr:serine hydrolase [Candidatus Paceibacterota bacterium]